MKKRRYSISAIFVIILTIASCDKVEGPYIEGNPFTGVYDSDLPIRKILLEDFTGFGCTNCPEANEEIHNLQNRYGGHVIPIAIHTGWFAIPHAADDPDYRTNVGNDLGGYYNDFGFFNIQEQPIGVINRMETDDGYKISHDNWSAKIVEILSLNKFADIDIVIQNELDTSNSILNISINIEAINDINSAMKLAVYIVENHVIGRQKDGSQVIEDYEHNHMLRAGVNGPWGDEISTDIPFEAGEELSASFTDTLNTEWVAANCEVIAFAYNSETFEVIQAEIKPVISE